MDENRQFRFDDAPDDSVIHLRVGVYEDVTKGNDAAAFSEPGGEGGVDPDELAAWDRSILPNSDHYVSIQCVALFIPQGFDGVEARGADGGDHAANEAGEYEDDGGHDDGRGRDDEADVGGFSVQGELAVERDASDED